MSYSESSGSTRDDAADSEIIVADNESVSASASSTSATDSNGVEESSESDNQSNGMSPDEENTAHSPLCSNGAEESTESDNQSSAVILDEENVAHSRIPVEDVLLPQSLSCHTCPICLSENQVFYSDTTTIKCKGEEAAVNEVAGLTTNDAAGNDKSLHEIPDAEKVSSLPSPTSLLQQKYMYQNQHGVPVFQLTSCGHSFCSPCLYAYIRSKLMKGTLQIPCCHFTMPDEAEDLHACDVDIPESAILQLIEMETENQTPLFTTGGWFLGSCCNSETINLRDKFEKIKFDNLHGKDSVRRCPKCDEPQLYDVERMKTFDADLRARSQSLPIAVSGRASATRGSYVENRTRLGRMLDTIRRRDNLNFVHEAGGHQSASSSRGSVSIHNSGCTDRNETPALANNIDESVHDDTEHHSNTSASQTLVISTIPIVKCQSCLTEFCYFHSNAHTGQTCEQYNEKTAELDRVNVEYANQTLHSKQCPTCGILVSKEGGCNQIKCGNCGTHFCWLCRAKVDDGAFPEHFRWWNLNGCPNMQLDASDEPMRCTVCMAKALSIAQLIVLGIPSIALAIASSLLCPCFVPGVGRTNRERAVNCVSFWGSFLSSVIMFPFSCIGMILLALMYCFTGMLVLILKCCGAMKRRLHRSTHAATGGVSYADDSPANEIPRELLIELERIFERIEEGRLEEGDDH